jgi:hypothetical protein
MRDRLRMRRVRKEKFIDVRAMAEAVLRSHVLAARTVQVNYTSNVSYGVTPCCPRSPN